MPAPTVADLDDVAKPLSSARKVPAFPRRTVLLGFIGSVCVLLGSLGAGGVLIHDHFIGTSAMSWIRYGHGREISAFVLYGGFALSVWAWIRMGRGVLAGLVGSRAVLIAAACWLAPMVIAPPVFTRDVFSYLGQGELALHGLDPYALGPAVLGDAIAENVHFFWSTTPAPYGPLFILVAKGVVWATGEHLILGVILMRLVLMVGLGLLVWALPGLVRHLGGRLPVALWLMIASPMTVIHLVGGPHNDLLMIGLLATGTLLVLEKKHVAGFGLVTAGMAVKATAGVALPFLVWVWASRLEGGPRKRFLRAAAGGMAVVVTVFAGIMLAAQVNFGWLSALHAPTMIVNWLNPPTAVGQILHGIVGIFGSLPQDPFVTMTRTVGIVALVAIALTQWWRARHGGADAVRRMGIVLCAVAVLSPPTLPWYFTWSFAILAGIPWTARRLGVVASVAVFLVLVYHSNGEDALSDWSYLAFAVFFSVLAGVSVVRYDPLRLTRFWKPAHVESAVTPAGTLVPPPPSASVDSGSAPRISTADRTGPGSLVGSEPPPAEPQMAERDSSA